jgi:hypothetical protein
LEETTFYERSGVSFFLSFSIHNLMIPKPQLFPPPSKEEEGKGENKPMKRFFLISSVLLLVKINVAKKNLFSTFYLGPLNFIC